jgi:hypothetical protein
MAAGMEAVIDTNLTLTGRVVISSLILPGVLYGPAETIPLLESRYREAGWVTRLDAHLLTIERPPLPAG